MSSSRAGFIALLASGFAATVLPLAGCASRSSGESPDGAPRSAEDIERINPRALPMFDGATGAPLSWDDLLARIDAVQVIIIGEQHDDALGHRVQQALVADALAHAGDTASSYALSLEMLERDEQAVVDDYLAGIIDRDRFIEETASTRWRAISTEYLSGAIKRSEFKSKITSVGWIKWDEFYQPSIDAAKQAGARVVAANAPWARYTSLITREDGYSKLESLSPAQRELVAWPDPVPASGYRERFWQFMAGRKEGEAPAERPEHQPGDPHSGQFTDEEILTGLMKQMLYDATMAESITRALRSGATGVIHFVGQFHSDFEGGTVIETRRRAPDARVLTLSLVHEGDGAALREEDRSRADVVVYTR